MIGKQRNTIGPYMIYNDGLDTLKVSGYTKDTASDITFSSVW